MTDLTMTYQGKGLKCDAYIGPLIFCFKIFKFRLQIPFFKGFLRFYPEKSYLQIRKSENSKISMFKILFDS